MLSKVRQIDLNWEMIKQDSEMLNNGASKIEDGQHFLRTCFPIGASIAPVKFFRLFNCRSM